MDESPRQKPIANQRIGVVVGSLLQIGVLVAAGIVLVGGTIYLSRHGREVPDFRVFHGQPADLRSLPGILHASAEFSGRGVIQLGLLALIATPLLRVLVAGIAFARERDWLYVVVALIVLVVLSYSLLSGGSV